MEFLVCTMKKKIASGHSASPDVSILTDWMLGSVRTALLDLALELELPDILHKTGTLEGIAAHLGNPHAGNLAHVLDAMAALGLPQKRMGSTPILHLPKCIFAKKPILPRSPDA